MALQIALAVSSGGTVFNETIPQGRVLYLALEDNPRRLQDRMKQQGWTPNIASNVDFYAMEEFRKEIGPLQKNGCKKLVTLIEQNGYRLVIIDTLSRAFIGLKNMNDSQDVTEALSPLQEVAIKKNLGILVIDHHPKPKRRDPNPVDDILGSSAKGAISDAEMGLYAGNEKYVYRLITTGRDFPGKDVVLKLNITSGLWQIEGETKKVSISIHEKEILEALSEGPLKLKEILFKVKQDKGNTSKRAKNLTEKNLLKKNEDGTFERIESKLHTTTTT
jgi:hypothetical protein